MSTLKEVDDKTFEQEVLKSDIPVLVDFGAEWCSPCKKQLPILEKLSDDFKDKVKFVSVNVDNSPILSSKFSIRSLPTIMLFNKGVSLSSKSGLMNPSILKTFISDSLNETSI